jgi:prostamide/prostaglandin F2alpha synthase
VLTPRSTLKDELDSIGVSLVAICLEELGLADFVDGKFFAGDLFLDVNKGCYKGLKFERKGIVCQAGGVVLFTGGR